MIRSMLCPWSSWDFIRCWACVFFLFIFLFVTWLSRFPCYFINNGWLGVKCDYTALLICFFPVHWNIIVSSGKILLSCSMFLFELCEVEDGITPFKDLWGCIHLRFVSI